MVTVRATGGHPAIKAVLNAASFSYHKARMVTIRIVDPEWNLVAEHVGYKTMVAGVAFDSVGRPHQIYRNDRSYSGNGPLPMAVAEFTGKMVAGGVLVMWFRGAAITPGRQGTEIIVPRQGWRQGEWRGADAAAIACSIDDQAIEVAVDAILIGGSGGSALRKRVDQIVEPCGGYAGIASAIAYGKARLIRFRHEAANALAESTTQKHVDDALELLCQRAGGPARDQLIHELGGLRQLYADTRLRRASAAADVLEIRRRNQTPGSVEQGTETTP